MASFEAAIPYVLANEGGVSDHPLDTGGFTKWGITKKVATEHGYDIAHLTPDEANLIYRESYWAFDGVRDQRVATKLLDMSVNVGRAGVARLAQRAVGVTEDGVWGPQTEDAINRLDPDEALELLTLALCDYYVMIARTRPSQMAFLKGWIRRGVKRPR